MGVILGIQWLEKLGEVQMNCKQGWLKFRSGGQMITLKGATTIEEKEKTSLEVREAWLKGEVEVFALRTLEIQSKVEDEVYGGNSCGIRSARRGLEAGFRTCPKSSGILSVGSTEGSRSRAVDTMVGGAGGQLKDTYLMLIGGKEGTRVVTNQHDDTRPAGGERETADVIGCDARLEDTRLTSIGGKDGACDVTIRIEDTRPSGGEKETRDVIGAAGSGAWLEDMATDLAGGRRLEDMTTDVTGCVGGGRLEDMTANVTGGSTRHEEVIGCVCIGPQLEDVARCARCGTQLEDEKNGTCNITIQHEDTRPSGGKKAASDVTDGTCGEVVWLEDTGKAKTGGKTGSDGGFLSNIPAGGRYTKACYEETERRILDNLSTIFIISP